MYALLSETKDLSKYMLTLNGDQEVYDIQLALNIDEIICILKD